MNGSLSLRARYLCVKYGRVVIVSLVVVSLLSFAAAATVATATPEPERVTVQTDIQSVQSSLTAGAVVTGNTTLYDSGAVVADQPVYLLAATPNLTVSGMTRVPDDRPVTISQELTLEIAATRDGEAFWTERRTLAATTREVRKGTARTTATVDVERLSRGRLATVRAEAGQVGTVTARVVFDVHYDTGTYAGRLNASAPLVVTDHAYEFETPRTTARNHSTPVTHWVEPSAGRTEGGTGGWLQSPGRPAWLGGMGAVALGAGAAVVAVRRSVGDADSLNREYERLRYTEWISRGRIPAHGATVYVHIESLVELVDVAIDSEKRVIHDAQQNRYAVIDGTVMYEFRDDDAETSDTGVDSHR
ncbi:DUF5305 family protein [Salinigranum halophilum]|uniref:DUF5305 family protein n=1 Tax=Salinigranum halophilum TaxID=2565931 RepID=UPI00115F1690|nr:DUF5305 family protein [Salinigranum halophilum]